MALDIPEQAVIKRRSVLATLQLVKGSFRVRNIPLHGGSMSPRVSISPMAHRPLQIIPQAWRQQPTIFRLQSAGLLRFIPQQVEFLYNNPICYALQN